MTEELEFLIWMWTVGGKMNKIKAIDLFSGCGGVSCGLSQAGFDIACALEIDKDAVQAYKNYKPLSKVKVMKQDICDTTGADILQTAEICQDELYLLAGCPPCQNFSLQNRYNKDKTEDEKKKLLLEYKRIIKEIYPPFVLMENVPGIKSSCGGKILKEFIIDLENEKCEELFKRYKVVFDVLNAADYCVPQTRKRFVLHAVRLDVYKKMKRLGIELILPAPTNSKNGVNGLPLWKTVGETIFDLPEIDSGARYNDEKQNIFNHYSANLSEKNKKRINAIRKNGGSRIGLPPELVLECHKIYTGHCDVYGIMRGDLPAPTITGGCLSYSKGRFGHPTQDRAISVREAARLQTFPDDYKFDESIGKAAVQIGNAVPVKLVNASAMYFMDIIKRLNNNE